MLIARYNAGRAVVWKTRPWSVVIACVLLLSAAEGLCRALGLHTPVLYEVTTYGFRPIPSQSLRRFGNRVFYNDMGLRSESSSPLPLPGVVRILCLGDSVTNGGTVMDQNETYPYRLGEELSRRGMQAEVLNASSPGWAVANEAGWLNRFGTLGSRYLVWTLNTYDLFQPAASAGIVGTHPSFPSEAPIFGLQELLFRYVLPRLSGHASVPDPGATPEAHSSEMARNVREAIASMIGVVRGQGTEPVLVLIEHPARMARQEIEIANLEGLLIAMKVPFAKTTEDMDRRGGVTLYRDGVHPNPDGNRVIASVLAQRIVPLAAP